MVFQQKTTNSDDRVDEVKELSNFEAHPLLYAHLILKQTIHAPHLAFMSGDLKAGFYSMIFSINLLERVYRAEGSLTIDWETDADYLKCLEKVKSDTDASETGGLAQKTNISLLKLEFILKKLFSERRKEVEVLI